MGKAGLCTRRALCTPCRFSVCQITALRRALGSPGGTECKERKMKAGKKKKVAFLLSCKEACVLGSCLQRQSPFREAALMQQEETCCAHRSLYCKVFLLGFNQEAFLFHLHPLSVQRLSFLNLK